VHRFQSVQIRDGASVDFGGDRIEIVDLVNSEISNATLTNIDLPQEVLDHFAVNNVDGVIHLTGITRFDYLTALSGNLIFDQLIVNDTTALGGTSNVVVEQLNTQNLIVDGGILTAKQVNVTQDVFLLNDAILTVPLATTNPNRLYSLDLKISGLLSIDNTSRIDLDGKGFPGNYAGPDFAYVGNLTGCHAGVSDDLDSTCSYGRYAKARLVGSGGGNGISGGGAANIQASLVVLEGVISASGISASISGAGGSIHIEANTLSGGGMIEARGGNSNTSSSTSRSGGGGRISVVVQDRSGFTGSVDTAGGAYSSSYNIAGAGTVYIHDTDDEYGNLIVNNTGNVAQASSTPIEHVGRHTITDVEDLGNERWQVDIKPTMAVRVVESGEVTSAAGAHYFTVSEAQSVKISVTATYYHYLYLFRDDGDLGTDDYIALVSSTTSGEIPYTSTITRVLEPGNYVVVMTGYGTGQTTAAALGNQSSSAYSGPYQIRIQSSDTVWRATNMNYDYGIQGLTVDLDRADNASPYYTIESNDVWSLIINTPDDLSDIVGNELIGVHRFQSVQFTGGASLDFGDDRYEIVDLSASTIDATSSVFNAETLPLTGLTVSENQTLRLDSGDIVIDGDLTIDGGNLIFGVDHQVTVNGNLNLVNGATLTVPNSLPGLYRIYELNLNVSGTITIDSSSLVDMSGKGYPRVSSTMYVGPEYISDTNRAGCHGGAGQGQNANCIYGRYQTARFAGSAGDGNGGGFVSLSASDMVLNGEIRSNGIASATTSFPRGAGGGVHLQLGSLTGSGRVEAKGGSVNRSDFRSGAGGRISVYATDSSGFIGEFDAGGGAFDQTRAVAGAGTIYLYDTDQAFGSLIVDNIGNAAETGTTLIEHTGRHVITGVADLGNDRWRIDVLPPDSVDYNEMFNLKSSGTGSIGYHYFTVPTDQVVEVTVNTAAFASHIMIFRDDGVLDVSDYINESYTGAIGSRTATFNLISGNYLAAVGTYYMNTTQVVNGSKTNANYGAYQVTIATPGYPWRPSNPVYEYGIQGLKVDLDRADDNSSLYTVESNDAWSLVVNTTDDLSGVAGNELIGVHQLDSIQILNGASVDFGGDRVEISNLSASSVYNAELINLDLPQDELDYFANYNNGTIHLTGDTTFNSLLIQADGLVFDRLTVNGDLDIMGGVTVTASGPIDVTQNMSLQSGAVLTVPSATVNPDRIYPLNLDVDGTLTIDTTSKIDLYLKGYPSGRVGPDFRSESGTAPGQGCHAGRRAGSTADCAYGRYTQAQFAGSGSTFPYGGQNGHPGGGIGTIRADALALDGLIRANGAIGGNWSGAAGGGLHFELRQLSGVGRIQALGGDVLSGSGSLAAGGGGRISIYVADTASFTGTYDPSGGANASTNFGGAGTVFIRNTNEVHGNLSIGNRFRQAAAGSTAIESIGRHLITDVVDLGDNRWQIGVAPANSVDVSVVSTLTASGFGSIGYHYFTVPATQTIEINVISDAVAPNIHILRDDGVINSGDFLVESYRTTVGPHTFTYSLAAGNYIVAIGDYRINTTEVINGVNISAVNSGEYQITVATSGYPWRAGYPRFDYGIQGLTIDMDRADAFSPLYAVESNSTWSFIVNTLDDLSGVVGNELIGVHRFNTINIGAGASVDFGGDRIEVENIFNSQVDPGSLINIDASSILP
jgi:hypothetical protein